MPTPLCLSSLLPALHSLPLLAHSICPIDRPRPAAPPWCTSLAIDIKICHSFFDVLYFLFDLSPLPLLHSDGKGMEAKYFIFCFLFLYKKKVCSASRALDGHPRWSLVVCRLFILHFSRHFILGYLRCCARGQPQKCGDAAWLIRRVLEIILTRLEEANSHNRPGLCMKSFGD